VTSETNLLGFSHFRDSAIDRTRRFDDPGAQIFMENLESENSIIELEKKLLKRLRTDTIGRGILLKELESNKVL
jgi:hypothetical protein